MQARVGDGGRVPPQALVDVVVAAVSGCTLAEHGLQGRFWGQEGGTEWGATPTASVPSREQPWPGEWQKEAAGGALGVQELARQPWPAYWHLPRQTHPLSPRRIQGDSKAAGRGRGGLWGELGERPSGQWGQSTPGLTSPWVLHFRVTL